uniref:Rho-GAP domain-containing protein n=1 Tax=Leersia perrieri TaxID=77586 RepID=A0A0D9WXW8_9ORYZ
MGEAVLVSKSNNHGCRGGGGGEEKGAEGQQGQVLALLLAALRRSVVLPCQMTDADDPAAAAAWGMEIGWPTDVRHVAHVTFDRLNGFLGLPVEFELEIPGHVPSASASVFGVSPESMQCGYDPKGNSVPKILLLMQDRLYAQDGLKAEGIFRITPENSQEENVREQLNRGVVPDGIDVHCLASLIKAWFRELPEGVLDSLSPEQVLHCNTEEECFELVRLLPPTQAALLNWVVEFMADVVEEEESNKMNARNVAMVFAPNMTKMSDPLTALMHAVHVMNLLKTLILKTLREREQDDDSEYSTISSQSSLSDELDEEHHDVDRVGDNESDNDNCGDDGCQNPKDVAKVLKQNVDNEQLIGISRRHTSTDFCLPHFSYSSDDDVSPNDIEECFLRRLEWSTVNKETSEIRSITVRSNQEALQLSFCGENNGYCSTNDDQTRSTKDSVCMKSTIPRETKRRTEITNDEVQDSAGGDLTLWH